MSDVLGRFDSWFDDHGPAAITLREALVPVEGHDGVVFPPTFAAGDSFPGGYNIDTFPDGANVCLIDSVGSQANRIEPLFSHGRYAGLVPQIVITAGDHRVNLLDAGHRAADAIVRCSALQATLREAFEAVRKGNATLLAQIAPTSLVFGAWDSRDTQAKVPRLVASSIRAYNVKRLTRSAQFVPAIEYVDRGLLDTPADKASKDAYAERGFAHVPSSAAPGGVIAAGGIRREATLHLAALRLLSAGSDAAQTRILRRYVLGLSLIALTHPSVTYLRQGCNLVPEISGKGTLDLVHTDGRREALRLPHDDAFAYAQATAREFGLDPERPIGKAAPDREVAFDKELAKQDLAGKEGSGAKRGKGRGGKAE